MTLHYNYHTHTHRCGHASGTEEEYIKRAIEKGIKYMGFSDHIPFAFPDGSETPWRVPTGEGKLYCDELKALAEKYKDQIEIKVGFESEYYPEYFDAMLKEAIQYGAEYLILGPHFIKPENTGVRHTIYENDCVEDLKNYVDMVISAMQRGVFTYIAHPDIFHFTGDKALYQKEMRRMCAAARELQVPLELNFLGIRSGRNYPNELFWQVAGEEKAPVTFGFDAHDVPAAYDGVSLVRAMEMVELYDLHYIGKPNLILIQE